MRLRTAGMATLVIGSGAVVLRRLQHRASHGRDVPEPMRRWHAVTVNRAVEDVMPDGRRPEPLEELGPMVEVEVRPAPGDKGTELRARLREPGPSGAASAAARIKGDDPRERVRSALRRSKQLIEVGEVLRVDPTPHGRRTATPTGALVEAATKRAAGEGLL